MGKHGTSLKHGTSIKHKPYKNKININEQNSNVKLLSVEISALKATSPKEEINRVIDILNAVFFQ